MKKKKFTQRLGGGLSGSGAKILGQKRNSKPNQKWALERVLDHELHVSGGGGRVMAWYLADPQTWSFKSQGEGEHLIYNYAHRLSELIGSTIHGRITSRPYPVAHWAERAWNNAPEPQEGFKELLIRDQRHMSAHAQADKLVYFGVDLGMRPMAVQLISQASERAARREMELLREQRDRVDAVMRGIGLEAVPAAGRDMEWLLMRSFALGCPVPVPHPDEPVRTDLDGDDLDEFIESVSWHAEPLSPTVEITSSMQVSEQHTRHIAVMTVGRMGEISIPEKHEPWMALTDQLDFPVEWSWRVEPRSPAGVAKEMGRQTDKIDSQVDHWRVDHDKRPPKQLARQASRAADVEDEMRSEFSGLSTRTRGWYRIAVSGTTQREALDKADAVAELFGPQIKVHREMGQYHLAREFVPGEPQASKAHARHLPVLKVAAGVPMVTAEVGDKRGFHIGETASIASRAVTFDPHYLPEVVEGAGLYPLLGTLGAGKSVLMGLIIAKMILSGVRGAAIDPAGRLQRLMRVLEIAKVCRSVELIGGQPGSLSPYAVVPDPNPGLVAVDLQPHEDFDEKMRLARLAAEETRRQLTYSTLLYCHPYLLAQETEVQKRLYRAIEQAPALRTSSATNVVEILEKGDAGSKEMAEALQKARRTDIGRLYMGAEVRSRRDVERGQGLDPGDARFTFYNFKGLLRPPAEADEKDWQLEERIAAPVMRLGSWASLELIYNSPPDMRKLFGLDEAGEHIGDGGAGRQFMYKLSSDSRKNNCAVLAAAQNASTILGADVDNFVGGCFVGRCASEKAQADALKLLGKPEGAGYEQLLSNLSARSRREENKLDYREFIYRDGLGGEGGTGGMEKIRVTLDHHPEIKAALNSTPDGLKVSDSTAADQSSADQPNDGPTAGEAVA